jgi:predicted enzyme related to lactoylglutathione lyase
MQPEPAFGAPCWVSYDVDRLATIDFYRNLFRWKVAEMAWSGPFAPPRFC